jgi:hypothetical protein
MIQRRLKSRLDKLATALKRVEPIRIALLKRLPPEYMGERHIVVVKRPAPDNPGYECEERPGPAARVKAENCTWVYCSEADLRL